MHKSQGKPAKPGNVIPPKAVEMLKRYTTARKLSRGVGVSKVHAYRIIELIGAKRALQSRQVREKPTGPLATAYRFKRS